ncbi:MAG: phage holin family protein [Lachnospiraceae bacterium]|nr:phage holin family protein [Lachnospiraceae bacterium]
MKYKLLTITGLVGSTIVSLLGGWDTVLQTLVIFMIIDWFTGGVLLPVVSGKSSKSSNGALESRAGWKGLCRKYMTLLYVLIAVRRDILMGTEYLRDAVCIGFILNEAVSIIENAGLMGIPLPGVLRKAVDILKEQSGDVDDLDGGQAIGS